MRLIDDNALQRFGKGLTNKLISKDDVNEKVEQLTINLNTHTHDPQDLSFIGDLNSLETEAKNTLVNAINEIYGEAIAFEDEDYNKALIANAFGEPLSADSNFYTMSNGITNLLNEFKGSLTKKGVEVNSDDKYKQLINKISILSYNEPYIIKKVICGNAHLFILKQDGNVMSCGYNLKGQLGLGDIKNRVAFTKVEIDNVKDIYCGQYTTYLVKEDGSLWACGSNKNGQLGLGFYDEESHPTFVQVPFTGGNIAHIACGENYAIIVCEDGSIWGCGDNSFAQLGIDLGDDTITLENVTTFTKGSINNVKKVACGAQHTIALKNDGTVWGIGYNLEGELGLGNTETKYSFVDTGLSNIKDIACGYWYSFAITNSNEVYATGYNNKGQLGLGDTTDRYSFTKVDINEVYQIACGYNSTYILKTNGSVWVTGYNNRGQLGLGDTTDRSSFTKATVADSYDILQVAVGVYHGYILSAEGTLWVTGSNEFGQLALGFGATSFKEEFTKVDLYSTSDTSQMNKYDYNVEVFFQTDEPTATQYGDIWIPLNSSDYDLYFVKDLSEINAPNERSLCIKIKNCYVDFSLNDSINDFILGYNTTFNLNLEFKSPDYNTNAMNLPILKNDITTVIADIGFCKKYNTSISAWEKVYAKYWDGTQWKGLISDEDLIAYLLTQTKVIAMDVTNNTTLWSTECTHSLRNANTQNDRISKGRETIACITTPSERNEGQFCELHILNIRTGELIKTVELFEYTYYSVNHNVCFGKDGAYHCYYSEYLDEYGHDVLIIWKVSEEGEILQKVIVDPTPDSTERLYEITLFPMDECFVLYADNQGITGNVFALSYDYSTVLGVEQNSDIVDAVTLFSGVYANKNREIVFINKNSSMSNDNDYHVTKIEIDMNNKTISTRQNSYSLPYRVAKFHHYIDPDTLEEYTAIAYNSGTVADPEIYLVIAELKEDNTWDLIDTILIDEYLDTDLIPLENGSYLFFDMNVNTGTLTVGNPKTKDVTTLTHWIEYIYDITTSSGTMALNSNNYGF